MAYYEHEILNGTQLMEEAGYESESFAYPMGSRDVVIDALILQNYSVLNQKSLFFHIQHSANQLQLELNI